MVDGPGFDFYTDSDIAGKAYSFISGRHKTGIMNKGRQGISYRGPGGIILVILLGLAFLQPINATASEMSPVAQEYKVKAMFLYNFSLFVEWPAESRTAGTPFRICILGKSPFGDFLNRFENQEVKGKKLKVQYVSSIQDIGSCQILFVCASEQARLREIMEALRERRGILSISDIPGFTEAGGVINIVKVDERLKFDINMSASKFNGLSINHQLLNMAHDITH